MPARTARCSPGLSGLWRIETGVTGRPLARASSAKRSISATRSTREPPIVSSRMPRPDSPIAATSRVSSRSSASRLGTGRPRSPTWFVFAEEESPTAPAAIASRTAAAMRSISSSDAARSHAAAPITYCRIAEWQPARRR